MKQFLAVLFLSLGVVAIGPAAAQPQQPMPESAALPQILIVEKPNPQTGWVTMVKDTTVYKNIPFAIEEKVVVNGMEMTVSKVGYKMVPEIVKVHEEWLVGENIASDVAGNKLTKDEAFKRLQPGTAVLVLPPGQKLSPALQRLFHKDTVILFSGGKIPG